eukprot:CAMPEP_0170191742 /NCGR_PEP_ID=MMETSP0040_2-20121228/52423_1 /TAXON_ID=641309 /ORGANISM="Lotharella oceanica, Strain CCMP622" /LENGTH=31 /DNA_ID= /DNA_START= /DNA_END= /DNA_ORIENTATION=
MTTEVIPTTRRGLHGAVEEATTAARAGVTAR